MSYEEHPMADHMRSFQHREETGRLPDDVYYPTSEDDQFDPDQIEIREAVMEQYAQNNAHRREETLRHENAALRSMLEENGIEVPDEV